MYRDGSLVDRELCGRADAAADVVAYWRELEGVECVVDDLAVRRRPGQILEPRRGGPTSTTPTRGLPAPGWRAERSPETNHANAIMRSIEARAFDAVGWGTVTS